MMRMGGADAFMLAMETPCAYMHTFKVAILDPSTAPGGWSFDSWREDFERRLHLVPFLRWKIAPTPLGINHPMWLDDPDFNLDHHVRRVACPSPGDRRALCEFMSSAYACQLDRSRPLWIAWVVEGLQGGRVAIVSLLHHAYVDGVGAAWDLQQLYREEPGFVPERVPPWQPRPWPSWGKRLWWGLRDLPALFFENLPRMIRGVRKKIELDQRYRARAEEAPPTAAMMQQTPINRNLSPGRTFVCDSLPLEDFRRVSRNFGVTINDVFLACCAGAIRKLFIREDFDPDQHPLISGTPFAGRRPDDMPGVGNFATVDYCWLPTDVDDPRDRLLAAHEAASDMKAHLRECVASDADINAIFQLCPPWLIKALRWYIHRRNGHFSLFANVVLSNVQGPGDPIFLNRYKLDSWFSTGQVFDGTALNMTLWSYCGAANLCILADSEIITDGWVLFDDFADELAALVKRLPSGSTAESEASG